MRMTLDLPEDLLADAMEVAKAETKTAVVVLALQELVRKSRIAGIKKFKGKVDLDIDLEKLRKPRK